MSFRFGKKASFQVWSVCVYGLSGGVVLVLNHNRPRIFSREEGLSIGKDRKCDQQMIEIHGFKVGGAKVRIQSHLGSAKYL